MERRSIADELYSEILEQKTEIGQSQTSPPDIKQTFSPADENRIPDEVYAEQEDELDALIKQFVPIQPQVDASNKELQHSVLKPPQIEFAPINEPVLSDQSESDSELEPRKKRKTYSSPDTSTPTEPTTATHSTEDTPKESTEPIPKVHSFTDASTDPDFLDKLFQAPPSANGAGSSSGKSKVLDDEPVDLDLLQRRVYTRRVYTLEQDSITKDLIIGNLEQDLEDKAAQISTLQANLGGLSAIVFDLKQRLSEKFPDEFPVLAEEDATQSTGLSRQRPPRSSTVPPPPDQNIDDYLASGPSTTEDRQKLKRK